MTDYSAQRRRDMKTKGQALPNPSDPDRPRFPIANAADLKNAIRLAGHAKGDPAKIRAFIRRRAKALGLTDLIPDSWS